MREKTLQDNPWLSDDDLPGGKRRRRGRGGAKRKKVDGVPAPPSDDEEEEPESEDELPLLHADEVPEKARDLAEEIAGLRVGFHEGFNPNDWFYTDILAGGGPWPTRTWRRTVVAAGPRGQGAQTSGARSASSHAR